jgi:hypothetical protein
MMKQSLFIPIAVLMALLFGSCVNTKGVITKEVIQEEEPIEYGGDINATFKQIYDKYHANLILDGAQAYRVVKGDTLSMIAKKQYGAGNGYFFPVIMLASNNVVLDPDFIEPGMALTIPSLQKNLDDPNARKKIKSFLADISGVYDKKGDVSTKNHLVQLAETL